MLCDSLDLLLEVGSGGVDGDLFRRWGRYYSDEVGMFIIADSAGSLRSAVWELWRFDLPANI